ncbi:MAG: bifunctional UDP-3-O-[3-hydroxymyristoyl] N-acetylglucosamine deacetylase/3-hydroxyacyl-ACP dehydratase [Candidatus Omnitrophota bacterium]
MVNQQTIKEEVSLPEGIGLHTGKKVKVKFRPAPVGEGIVFIRVDLTNKPQVPASISHVIDETKRSRRTSVGINSVEVHTIEHLMAALCGSWIDNIYIEISGEELPGYDGSAWAFYQAIKEAGIKEQSASKKIFKIKEPIWMEEDDASIIILPGKEFQVSYTLNYEHQFLRSQYANIIFNNDVFEREIASSRTFCMENEIERLRAQGLGKGADYNNTIVVTKDGILGKLRFPDEFVRHKISDLMGDLYLLGCMIEGHVIAIKSGHSLNIKLLHKIKAQLDRYDRQAVNRRGSLTAATSSLDITSIQKILPHRYPFLLVDRILELEDRYAAGIKNVTINEQFFNGHFPAYPVMPGVLIIEAMAQVAGVLMLSRQENLGKLAYFMSMDKVKFRKRVVPGDQLLIKVTVGKVRSRVLQVEAKAFVDGRVVTEADLMFSLGQA